MQNPDKGVVGYYIGSGGPLPTFFTANGAPGTAKIVVSGSFRRSDTFYAGGKGTTTLTVQGTITSATFGVVVGLERQRGDTPNAAGGSWPWSVVSTVRTDAELVSGGLSSGVTGMALAPLALQTIKRTDLIGQIVDSSTGLLVSGSAAETLAVTLLTPELFLGAGGASVILRACSGGLSSGDYVVVGADCG